MLRCRENYVKKLIECKVEKSEMKTVKNDLYMLEELSVLKKLCEKELILNTILVTTDQKRLNKVNE